jgi:hypothetical protein
LDVMSLALLQSALQNCFKRRHLPRCLIAASAAVVSPL